MNTTPSLLDRTYKTVAAGNLNVGDALVRGTTSEKRGTAILFDEKITGITLAEEGYVSLRLYSGDLSMCEVSTPVLIRTN